MAGDGWRWLAMAAEVTFMIGPAAGVMLARTISTVLGRIIFGVSAALAGLLLIWTNPPTRTGQKGSHVDVSAKPALAGRQLVTLDTPTGRFWGRTRSNRAWNNLAVLSILGTSLGAGLVLNGTNVGMVAVLSAQGQEGILGIVFFFWCGASLVGRPIYGSPKNSINPTWLLGGTAILVITMGFAADVWSLGRLFILPGLLCAPVGTSSAEHIADLVVERMRGEAMGWYGSSMTIGGALGALFAGAMIDRVGPWADFVTIGSVAGVLAIAGLIVQGAVKARRPKCGPKTSGQESIGEADPA